MYNSIIVIVPISFLILFGFIVAFYYYFLIYSPKYNDDSHNRGEAKFVITPAPHFRRHIEQSKGLEDPFEIARLSPSPHLRRHIEQSKGLEDPFEIARLSQLSQDFLVSIHSYDEIRWDILLAVADVYRRGAFPRFVPNVDIASQLYKITAMCPNSEIAGLAQGKYIECYAEPIHINDIHGAHLPTYFGQALIQTAQDVIYSLPKHMFNKPIQKQIVEEDRHVISMRNIEHRLDLQNVHDHGVTRTTKYNIESLKEKVGTFSFDQSANIIERILSNKEVDARTKEDALYVIDNLSDSSHGTLEISEKEALNMVWEFIQRQSSREIKENLVETLAKQLASSIENGQIVCSSGKITRILSTLDGISNEIAKPLWAIREELGSKAAQIRDSFNEKSRMQHEFSRYVNEEYIEKLGMSPDIINPLIAEYEVGFE